MTSVPAQTSSGTSAAAWAASPSRNCSPRPGDSRLRRSRRPSSTAGCITRPRSSASFQLFMNGGVSQMDTFDYKPELDKRHGQTFDPGTGEKRRGRHQHARQPDEEPVRVQAARPVRPLGQQRLPAPRRSASTTWRS